MTCTSARAVQELLRLNGSQALEARISPKLFSIVSPTDWFVMAVVRGSFVRFVGFASNGPLDTGRTVDVLYTVDHEKNYNGKT